MVVAVAGLSLGLALSSCGGGPSTTNGGSGNSAPAAQGPIGPEGVPVPNGSALAGSSASVTGQEVDGIKCEPRETVSFRTYARVTIFVDGFARQIPAGIGILDARGVNNGSGILVTAGKCFYWLNTHAADGVISTEAPAHKTYVLGNFFDLWGQPLGTDRVGPAFGHVTAYVGGQLYKDNPRGIPLSSHAQIQLDVGTPRVAPESINFPAKL